jgi:hypothetical protein
MAEPTDTEDPSGTGVNAAAIGRLIYLALITARPLVPIDT